MLRETLQSQELAEHTKCIKCGKRRVTDEDGICDSCRFMITLTNITKDKKNE
ncbi:hypothetical protein KEJ15_07615 [Candidatus Bathyarchaeota archaeon]|nr:hypothetical protein [Candidatus Bathyarchaeota archaeon]